MTVQEAIKYLRLATDEAEEGEFSDVYRDMCEMSIKALEKQIPKKIKEIHVDEYYCPACGAELTCNDAQVEDKYCRECGQRLGEEGGTSD